MSGNGVWERGELGRWSARGHDSGEWPPITPGKEALPPPEGSGTGGCHPQHLWSKVANALSIKTNTSKLAGKINEGGTDLSGGIGLCKQGRDSLLRQVQTGQAGSALLAGCPLGAMAFTVGVGPFLVLHNRLRAVPASA